MGGYTKSTSVLTVLAREATAVKSPASMVVLVPVPSTSAWNNMALVPSSTTNSNRLREFQACQ